MSGSTEQALEAWETKRGKYSYGKEDSGEKRKFRTTAEWAQSLRKEARHIEDTSSSFDPVTGFGVVSDWVGSSSTIRRQEKAGGGKWSRAFNEALDQAPTYKGVVYRGISCSPAVVEKYSKVGAKITFDASASCSKSASFAKGYAEDRNNGIVFEIQSRTAVDLGRMSLGGEREVVARSGTKYVVTAVTPMRTGYTLNLVKVTLKEISRGR